MELASCNLKNLFQRLYITIQFFHENGLANHAAAAAYGFLLSAAPTLLLVSFFLLAAFRSSPQAIVELVMNIPYLEVVFDEDWLNRDFLALSKPGISGLVSAVSIFWAGRVFALSLQRGIKVVFTGAKKRSPVRDNLAVIFIELLVVIFVLAMILCSQTALRLYSIFDFFPNTAFFTAVILKLRLRIFPLAALGLISWFAYRLIPANAPGRLAALGGVCCFIIPYEITSLLLQVFITGTRYNFLYGALGSLIILLVNVYFFFVFFFFGAQFARVAGSFDAFLFSKLRQTRAGKRAGSRRLFFSTTGRLEKYVRSYRQGETIFSKGEEGDEIFYLLEGEIEVFMPSNGVQGPGSALQAGSFFGETGPLLSRERCTTARAKTAVSALALPPPLFDEILQYDAGLDRTLLEHLSMRLNEGNLPSLHTEAKRNIIHS